LAIYFLINSIHQAQQVWLVGCIALEKKKKAIKRVMGET
jgi:hypothetical protein